jgi:Phage tail tube protein, TTP
MGISTASGTKVYVGPQVTDTQADTLAEFQALSGWQEIGLVESLGEFGDESNDVTFASLGDARTRHAKGARDAGTMVITCGHDPLDQGQINLENAEATEFQFAFRVTLSDSPGGAFQNSEVYFRGLVMSKRKNVGNNDNVIRNVYNVGINSELFTDPSHSV